MSKILILVLVFLFLPALMFLCLKWRGAKKAVRSIYDHYCYSRMTDAARTRRLLAVYDVFKRYRPEAREEKVLKATSEVYFEVMRWREAQTQSALNIIGQRIGREIKSVKDLAKAILVLKKPCLGRLYDSDYMDKFRAVGNKDRTIELVLSENSADRPKAGADSQRCR